ncbi:hypothetical protein EDB19DRAFT_444891 [Suillus lakei]|nr:hypothetical protein EDB19DRAFT_444891 [Suillus lakei]
MGRLLLSVRLLCMGLRLLLRPRRCRCTPWIAFSGPFFFLDFRGISALFPASFVAPVIPGRLIHSALSGLTPVTFRDLLFRWRWRSSSIFPSSATASPSLIILRLLVVLVLAMLLLMMVPMLMLMLLLLLMLLMLLLLVLVLLLFLRLGVATVLLRWLWWHLCLGRSARLPLLIIGPVSVAILRIVGRPAVQILWVIAGLMHLLPRILIKVSGIHITFVGANVQNPVAIDVGWAKKTHRVHQNHHPLLRSCLWSLHGEEAVREAGEAAVAVVGEQEEVQMLQQESPSACPSCYWHSWASYPTRATQIRRLVFSDALTRVKTRNERLEDAVRLNQINEQDQGKAREDFQIA